MKQIRYNKVRDKNLNARKHTIFPVKKQDMVSEVIKVFNTEYIFKLLETVKIFYDWSLTEVLSC